IAFFGVFFVLYNIAMSYTTAARASLALATLPLSTMVVGAVLGIGTARQRKSGAVAPALFWLVGILTVLNAAIAVLWR
uniref:hypothetical protein n=1 Tax=Streptomyces galilaeus TaxID=33899 RepID=UPI0038F7A9DF